MGERLGAADHTGLDEPGVAKTPTTVEPARRELLEALAAVIDVNAANGRRLASDILDANRRTNHLANALMVTSIVLAALMAWLLYRQAQSRQRLFHERSRILEERAAELEQFAGRVAHDIRNPIGTASLGAELIRSRSSDDSVRQVAGRVIRSLARANAITSALLDFARSGARPEPGARTDVRAVLADAIAGLAPEAERAQVELDCGPVPSVLAGCSEGVYLSLAGNLIRNALKYMGPSSMRRVDVRVMASDATIRTEVSDTGPRISREALPTLFEPYFRAQRGGDGLGLGLATVKKLAEGHGGRVGVSSSIGKGSTFWFELPNAGRAPDTGEADAGVSPPELHH